MGKRVAEPVKGLSGFTDMSHVCLRVYYEKSTCDCKLVSARMLGWKSQLRSTTSTGLLGWADDKLTGAQPTRACHGR